MLYGENKRRKVYGTNHYRTKKVGSKSGGYSFERENVKDKI
jgi:hypothetical protein